MYSNKTDACFIDVQLHPFGCAKAALEYCERTFRNETMLLEVLGLRSDLHAKYKASGLFHGTQHSRATGFMSSQELLLS